MNISIPRQPGQVAGFMELLGGRQEQLAETKAAQLELRADEPKGGRSGTEYGGRAKGPTISLLPM